MKILIIGITHPLMSTYSSQLLESYEVKYIHYKSIKTDLPKANYNEFFDVVICIVPIWTITKILESYSIMFNHILAFSSTSIITKKYSDNMFDQLLSEKYERGESSLIHFLKKYKSTYTIFRTTMLWGYLYDKNISRIIRTAIKYKIIFYPMPSKGYRAPIHFSTLIPLLDEYLYVRKSETFNVVGSQRIKLKNIIKTIAKKYNVFSIALPIPSFIFRYLYNRLSLKIFNDLAGFLERSNKNLDCHNVNDKQTIYLDQKELESYL